MRTAHITPGAAVLAPWSDTGRRNSGTGADYFTGRAACGFSVKRHLLAQPALNQQVANIENGSPFTAPGVPKNYPDAKKLVTEDCIRPLERMTLMENQFSIISTLRSRVDYASGRITGDTAIAHDQESRMIEQKDTEFGYRKIWQEVINRTYFSPFFFRIGVQQ